MKTNKTSFIPNKKAILVRPKLIPEILPIERVHFGQKKIRI